MLGGDGLTWGPASSPLIGHSQEVTRMTPSFGGSASLPTPPSLDLLPSYFPPPWAFSGLTGRRETGTYQLAVMSFFFFFFNKTEQNQKNPRQWCLVDLFIMQRQRVGRPVLLTAKGRPPKPPLPCSLSLRDVSVPRACAVCVQTLGGQIVASEGREGAGPAWLGQSYFWNQLGCEAGGGVLLLGYQADWVCVWI